MKFTSQFSELTKKDTIIAGGKGASLGEMTQAGISVPGGFVVLSTTFDHFLHETDLAQVIEAILKTVDHKAIHTIESASEKIRGLIETEVFPEDIASEVTKEFASLGAEFVAVRSSATAEDGAEHAWAGQLDSFLNTTEETLLENVKRCWSSLFTPRAIFYRFEKGLHGTEISVAVVVQKMVQSEISGISFSVHPITEDRNQLIIEAGFGLGEAIVSGSITPDSYVVEKEPRKVIDINVNTQKRGLFKKIDGGNEWIEIPEPKASSQVLSESQVLELSELIIKIEKHYGFPCDIEWAYEDGKFYITQSRPITTLSNKINDTNSEHVVDLNKYEKTYTRECCLMAFQVWEAHQTKYLKGKLGWTSPPGLYDVTDGIGEVYFVANIFPEWEVKMAEQIKQNKSFVIDAMEWYRGLLIPLEKAWRENKPFENKEALIEFYEQASQGWVGLAISYFIPGMNDVSEEDKKAAMEMREKAAAYLDDTNRILEKTLKFLYPSYGDLALYLCIEEIIRDELPSEDELKSRKKHYIYFKNKIITDTLFKVFLEDNGLKIEEERVEFSSELIGQTAMKGLVRGKVRIIRKRENIGDIKVGEILVTHMTTPDYLPAMDKAAAFVTDEGGITSHAAIVAREMGKPCIIGTKFATQILKDGDLVEVDANVGIVKIIQS